MAPTAIISDIHANIHALRAVLDHARSQGAERIVCLGDVVGYGAHPEECADIARTFAACLRGNHEEATHGSYADFNAEAKAAAIWTRDRLRPGLLSARARKDRWAFIQGLPKTFEEDGIVHVHGSPRNPVWEYIFDTDCIDLIGEVPEKVAENLALISGLCLVGHTHIPGIIRQDGSFTTPDKQGAAFELEAGSKAIVNVGSVGQPRDRNPQACYVIRDGTKLTFHRVEYDVAAAARDISAAGLPPLLGERLALGM